MSGYTFEKRTHYTTIRFTSELAEMPWEDVNTSTQKVTALVLDSGMHSVLVDLSELETLPSGVVASLVKTWKGMNERQRRFFVVAPHQHVRDEIEQAGLTKLWTISKDIDSAYRGIGVTGQTDGEFDRLSVRSSAADSDEPFDVTEQHAYLAVTWNPKLKELDWQAVESATSALIQEIEDSPKTSLMVDLSRMEYINSGLVASLVRIWKASQQRKGQFALVCPNDFVTQVLQSSGLMKLWTVVDSREEAVYELGVSTAAKTEVRERRVLMLVALPCAVIAALATLLMLFSRDEIMGVNAQLTALLLGAAALATGGISIWKDTGLRRQLSGVSVVLALLVLSTLWFKENPIGFGHMAPNRNFDRDDDDGKENADKPPEPDSEDPEETDTDLQQSASGDAASSSKSGGFDESISPTELSPDSGPPSDSTAKPDRAADPQGVTKPDSAPQPVPADTATKQ